MSGHVFVSFSPSDGGYVQQLIFHLTAAGLVVWTDQQGSAEDGITTCAAFVPVISADSAGSQEAQQEVEQAKVAFRPILPLALGATDVPAGLAGIPAEDVTGGRMPPPHFVEQLRRLVAAQPSAESATIVPTAGGSGGLASAGVGAPGGPRFTDAVPVPPKKKSRRGLIWGLVIGFVLLLVLCVGIALVLGLNQLRETSAENAVVGDCLAGGADGTNADEVRKVDCGDADATFTVIARVENKTSAESNEACGDDADFAFWTGPRDGGAGTVLCLQRR
jgi:hypothetical protein